MVIFYHMVSFILSTSDSSFKTKIVIFIINISAMGMSSNYIFINLTGYVMYTVYNLYGWTKGNNT